MGAPRRLAASRQLELFASVPARGPRRREVPAAPALRAHRYLEGDAASIRVGNEWLDELLQARGMGWVIELEAWLRRRVVLHTDDPALRFPEALLRAESAGARPLSPLALFAAVLIGTLLGITSLRALERWAAADLRALWILGGFAPDHSTFGRFLLRLQGGVSEELFERLTEEALREVGRSLRDVSLDATTLQAATSRYRRLGAEAVARQLAEAQAAAGAAPDDAEAARAVAHAEACARALAEGERRRRDARHDPAGVTVCPSDLEAVVHKLKEGHFAPAVLASVIATDDRFVVAAAVHATEEIAVVAPLLDQAERLAVAVHGPSPRLPARPAACAGPARTAPAAPPCAPGSRPLRDARCAVAGRDERVEARAARARVGPCGLEVVRADANYLTGVVLREEVARGVELRVSVGARAGPRPAPQGFNPDDRRAFDKSRFRLVVLPANDYAPERTCLQCPMGALLPWASRDGARPGDPAHDVYRAVGVRCGVCPYRARCAPRNPRRRVARYPDDPLKEAMGERLAAAPRRQDGRIRATSVEPVFSVVKGVQGLRRFRRRGLRKALLEWHLHLIAHNLRRMMSLGGARRAA